jgi:MarR family transcriptional regulator for hemolysin
MSTDGDTVTGMPEPTHVPVGLRLNQSARIVERAFDGALAAAGGTLPVWLILLNLKIRKPGTQRALAAAVGIRDATLTHHLNAMEADGLVTRKRDAANRRVSVVELTEKGDAAFRRLREAAIGFDAKLRRGLDDAELEELGRLLGTLASNAGGAGDASADGGAPWAGLAERPAGGAG